MKRRTASKQMTWILEEIGMFIDTTDKPGKMDRIASMVISIPVIHCQHRS